MRLMRTLAGGLRALFRKAQVERELDDEVTHFLSMATRAHREAGLTPDAAARAARLELGSIDFTKEVVRGGLWESSVEAWWRDARYGARRLRRSPGFTLVAGLSLALGIGANTAIFSLVEATLLRRLPVLRPEELSYVRSGTASGVFSYPDIAELREQQQGFTGIAAWGGIGASLTTEGDPQVVTGVIVTGNFFDVLGVHAARGRLLSPDDDKVPGAHPVAVISDGLWQRRFGARADAVGRSILLNGHPFTVIGITPPGFQGAQLGTSRDLYVPMMMQATMRPPRSGYSGEKNPDLLQVRGNRWLYGIGRLRPGVSSGRAAADLTNIERRLQQTDPQKTRNTAVTLSPVNAGDATQRQQMTSAALLLMSVVGTVLLIACANVANLLLARATSRRREIAVRLSIGATRGRLVRQLLMESVLLSAIGGAAGLALAWAMVAALRAAPPPAGALPIVIDFAIDGRVLAFTAALSLVTGVVFGLVPALRASRPDLVPALKDEQGTPELRWRRVNLRSALVVGQVALSLLLLISAGLFLRSLQLSRGISPGFDTNRLLTAPLNINLMRYTKTDGQRFYRDVVLRIEALPGVRSATMARWLPLTGGGRTSSLAIEGQAAPSDLSRSEGGGVSAPASSTNTVNVNVVGPKYLATMGIPLKAGRDFSDVDVEGSGDVVIVSAAFAKKHFAGQDPVGRRISLTGPEGPWTTIVGVAADSKLFTLDEVPTPVVYQALSQNHETGMTLIVRSAGNPAGLIGPVSREVHAIEKSIPLDGARLMSDWLQLSLYAARAGAVTLLVFGGLALVLATVGLSGVMSYAVARRTREIGLRMALGARASDVLRQVVREGMTLVAVGVVVGIAAAALTTRLLTSFVPGISATDPATFATVPLVLGVVGLLACVIPARRAIRVDPMVALRSS